MSSLSSTQTSPMTTFWPKDQTAWDVLGTPIADYIIQENPLWSRFSPPHQQDKEVAERAVAINGLALQWFSEEIQQNLDLQAIAAAHMPQSYLRTPDTPHIGSLCPNIFLASSDSLSSSMEEQLSHIKKNVLKSEWEVPNDENLISAEQLEECGIYNPTNYIKYNSSMESSFIRDSHVVLFCGTHLIPYTIKMHDILLHSYFRSILPHHAQHFCYSQEGEFGRGFEALNVKRAMTAAYDHNISFKCGKTTIEGGNCHLFVANGQRWALIGELSLYLSLIAVEEQGLLENLDYDPTLEPSEDIIRIVRNLHFYKTVKEPLCKLNEMEAMELHKADLSSGEREEIKAKFLLLKKKPVDILCDHWKKPITQEEKDLYKERAKLFSAQLEKTKDLVSEDLEIPKDYIVWIPQEEFHIDLISLISPEGDIIFHDNEEAITLLSTLRSELLNPIQQTLYHGFSKSAIQRISLFGELSQVRETILLKQGLHIKKLPLAFYANQLTLCLCNGLFFRKTIQNLTDKEYLLITTGPSSEAEFYLFKKLISIFQSTFPNVMVKGIPYMSHCIYLLAGGLHCFTFEDRLLLE